jgi:hypothetical protein
VWLCSCHHHETSKPVLLPFSPCNSLSVVHSGSRSTAGTPQASSLKGSKISFPIARLWACGLVGYGYHLSSPYPPNPILISSSAAQISLTPYPASLHHHRTAAPSPAAHLSRRCATSAATAAASALQAADTPTPPLATLHLHYRLSHPRSASPPVLLPTHQPAPFSPPVGCGSV